MHASPHQSEPMEISSSTTQSDSQHQRSGSPEIDPNANSNHTIPPRQQHDEQERGEHEKKNDQIGHEDDIGNGDDTEPDQKEMVEEHAHSATKNESTHPEEHEKEGEEIAPPSLPRIESCEFYDVDTKNIDESPDQPAQTDKSITESKLLRPHSHLPQPLAPPGIEHGKTKLLPLATETPPNTLSTFFRRHLSALKDPNPAITATPTTVTEFHITNLKVIVRLKDPPPQIQEPGFVGRITFFSRSNCRDCGAVRSFFRERRLPYVEINVDVFPSREAELKQRTGSASVPQVFFNEKLVGGLVALNTLRNSGEFEKRLEEMAGEKCGEGAPAVPVYGLEEGQRREEDELADVMREVRRKVGVRDFLRRMRIVRSCFPGNELVEAVIDHMDCGRKKAVQIGKELLRKHFIHHVFREEDFEDGNNLYRFLEHDPIVPRCFNFRVATNDHEPQPALAVGQQLNKLMFAILEAYASDDRRHLDYRRISLSEEFRRYVNVVHDLQRVDLFVLSTDERLAFFLNLYNAMAIHAVIRVGRPEAIMERRTFYNDFHYMVGGYPYSLSIIKNGILRSNSRPPYSLMKPLGAGDKRLELALPKVNPLIHFGLCNATRSSPAVQFFSSQGVEAELRQAARDFFQSGGVEVDLNSRTVHLARIINWNCADFLQDRELLKWILNFLESSKAGHIIHLLSDNGPINVVYQNYDWSLNV